MGRPPVLGGGFHDRVTDVAVTLLAVSGPDGIDGTAVN